MALDVLREVRAYHDAMGQDNYLEYANLCWSMGWARIKLGRESSTVLNNILLQAYREALVYLRISLAMKREEDTRVNLSSALIEISEPMFALALGDSIDELATEGKSYLDEAQLILEETGDPQKKLEGLYQRIAMYWRVHGDLVKSEQYFDLAITEARRSLGPTAYRLGRVYFSKHNMLSTSRQYKKAFPCVKEALKIFTDLLGPYHSDTRRVQSSYDKPEYDRYR
eukprot:GFYU01002933.1.p1 GENE.GFYU01002933.1~~GFYU01002933.1.p1  ORF type:complete len:244 (+),score=49.09 GFYU01002933.1:57-734(+)